MRLSFITFLLLINISFAQEYTLTGKVYDFKSNKTLEYATIKVADSNYVTTCDINGEYILHLKSGFYKLIVSYIGYFTDTGKIFIDRNNINRDFYLKTTDLYTQEINVLGEDPAYEIVKKAINYKKRLHNDLLEYNFTAYSKFVIRSNISPIGSDSAYKSVKVQDKENILGLLESETITYFRKPDLEKQIVISKKETANIVKGVAIPLIVNFYDEYIEIGETKIPGPLSDVAFDNYEYKLIGTTSLDSNVVYKIQVNNTSNTYPQFVGTIYIVDSLFALVKTDLTTNRGARIPSIDNLRFVQKFSPFFNSGKSYWMPTDVQIYADGKMLGLIKFQGEVFTIVSNYKINQKAPPGTFDEFYIKVLPDANKKDSAYWEAKRLIKTPEEEKVASKIIYSSEQRKEKNISLGLFTINFGKNLSLNWVEGYKFNRVEGHHFEANVSYSNNLSQFQSKGSLAYGFSDSKAKYTLNTSAFFLNDRRLFFNIDIFQNLRVMFKNPSFLSYAENTAFALLFKKDKYNYYYGNGYSLAFGYKFIPQLSLTVKYSQEKQSTATKQTDYSFLKQSELFSDNPPINDAFRRTVGFVAIIDPNSFRGIDWGTGEVSWFKITNLPTLTFGYDFAGKDYLLNTFDNRKFYAYLTGTLNPFLFVKLNYRFGGVFYSGTVPYQSLAYFNTSVHGFSSEYAFVTMEYNEFLGDRIYYGNIENNFGKILWGNIPILRNFDLIGFLNLGRSFISEENLMLAKNNSSLITNGIFVETGFGIGNILDLFRINFGWRLNNFNSGKNFKFSLSLVNLNF
ncbi:MAG: DUF5686 family protein [Ignavibacteria bacterium]